MMGEPGHAEMRQQGQQAVPREPSTTGPRQGVHWSSGAGGGGIAAATPPTGWNYIDSIATTELLPTRKVPPARGLRRVIYNATFGLINPGQSPDELRRAELMTRMRTPLRGHYKIGVLGKGGVGKTTVAASVGSIFARLRPEDRVVAIDADASFGQLGSRVDPYAPGSYWDLAAGKDLGTFADLRTLVGNNADGLFVLPGGSATAQRRVLDPAIYREATARLDRHFTISIIDCGATVDSPVTLEVLRDVDALILVSSPWVDGASAAAQTMEWLVTRGMRDLLHRTVVVLSDSDGHADKRTRTIFAQHFANQGQVVIEVPFDPHLRRGGLIDFSHEMNPKTRRRFYEIAAAIAEHFSVGTVTYHVRPNHLQPVQRVELRTTHDLTYFHNTSQDTRADVYRSEIDRINRATDEARDHLRIRQVEAPTDVELPRLERTPKVEADLHVQPDSDEGTEPPQDRRTGERTPTGEWEPIQGRQFRPYPRQPDQPI
jgi:MinD-like ATPase involved in chromosome partitioning or flagellar assembly